jgi:hypothetical protein
LSTAPARLTGGGPGSGDTRAMSCSVHWAAGRRAAFLVVLPVLVGIVCWAWLPPPTVRALFWEGGPIERITEGLYLAGAVAAWTARGSPRGGIALRLALSVVMLAAAAREADLHKHWTGTSVLRVSWYWSQAPAAHRLLAALVVGTVLVAAFHLLRRAWRGWWPALRGGQAHAATVAVLFATLLCGKVLDRSRAVLAESFGIVMAPATAALVRVLEETLEFALPLLAMLAIVQYLAPPPSQPR